MPEIQSVPFNNLRAAAVVIQDPLLTVQQMLYISFDERVKTNRTAFLLFV
jgi:hypothetical protein